MPKILNLPALSPTMTVGTIQHWIIKEGDTVKEGDVIAEIETDKAVMEMEATEEGILGKILIPEGSAEMPVGSPIGVLLEQGEKSDILADFIKNIVVDAEPADAEPADAVSTNNQSDSIPNIKQTRPESQQSSSNAKNAPPTSTPLSHSSGRIFASPLARKIAKDRGIDLASVSGTGPRGRIVKADVMSAKIKKVDATTLVNAPIGMPATTTVQPFNTYQKALIKQITTSKNTVPHFYVTKKARIQNFLDFRKKINAAQTEQKVSVNDMLIMALAKAYTKMPEVNVAYSEDGVVYFDGVDVSVAVAVGEKLFTPIVFGADKRSLVDISKTTKSLIEKTKNNKLRPEEFMGGTVSISNMGMLGVDQFTAIINVPQSLILAIASPVLEPLVHNDIIVMGTTMNLTISVDHRVINGATAAKFINQVVSIIEDPVALFL